MIMEAYQFREKANELLDKANNLFHRELDLGFFDDRDIPYISKPLTQEKYDLPQLKVFSTFSTELQHRFDSSFHVPAVKIAIIRLKEAKYSAIQLREIMSAITLPNRFKRVYVQQEYGVPFIQGSHLSEMMMHDLKYISKRSNEKNIPQCIVYKGYILLTRSGTIGKIGLVSSHLNGWGASEHLIRLIPNKVKANPGYITQFLLTEYGQNQILAKTYGGVVDEVTCNDIGDIWVPNAPIGIQDRIGKLVEDAYEMKDGANIIEQQAITYLENLLKKPLEAGK
jgi:type I restriction enzyme S subunit